MTLKQRFLKHVRKTKTCWIWTGSRFKNGYGRFWLDGKKRLAHRVAAHIWKGFDLTSSLDQLHHCDNPPCVRPGHLFSGTQKDNSVDSLRKGRHHLAKRTHCKNGHPYDKTNTFQRRFGRGC